MTPAARYQAAITVLDQINEGVPAERALTAWARSARYAGSGDRAAVRDHVFQVLRQKRSLAVLGGGTSGRALVLGLLYSLGVEIDTFFNGSRHAPAPLDPGESQGPAGTPDAQDGLDMPDWLLPELTRSLGSDLAAVCERLRQRAPVWLRVNLIKAGVAEAQSALAIEGISTHATPVSATALEVTSGARRLRQSGAFQRGLIELQDVSSQKVVDMLPLTDAARVLDFCAGGGGKALAIAARAPGLELFCHDAAPNRMGDIAVRATRAGARLYQIAADKLDKVAPFDLVLCDVPCSGSGAWARSPDAKWRLDSQRLDQLAKVQDHVLDRAASLVAPKGVLAYVTCSLLRCENEDRVSAFAERHPDWKVTHQERLLPTSGGDGFYTAHLTRAQSVQYSTKD
ncbi:MAG: RsmB/NOP family class I SAM-dependent RNA methyltransferase [Pseudomonadota bacterium]